VKRIVNISAAIVALAACSAGRAEENAPPPSTAEIKTLVDAGKYREALRPLFRVLALKGQAAQGYDRIELLMLRAECQMQLKDQRGTLETLEQARKECFLENRAPLAATPTGLAMLIQKSNAWQYKSKSDPSLKPIPILDKTLRQAAYEALLHDELPGAQKKVQALAGVKSIAPVLETAKLAGAVHALDILAHPTIPPDQVETGTLTRQVTSNADRLLLPAIDELGKNVDTIQSAANEITTDQVGHFDRASGKSWLEPRTRRRGPSYHDAETLNAINTTADKIRSTAFDIALALATDFKAYQEIIEKADGLKAKSTAVLNDNYLVVPP
jgi:hypothetical protein